ncbi:hypothetical protein ACFL6Y_05540 [Elusimicrobiota bacterium]
MDKKTRPVDPISYLTPQRRLEKIAKLLLRGIHLYAKTNGMHEKEKAAQEPAAQLLKEMQSSNPIPA